jgi:ribosomal peptide maturation radical SAM protein 1
MPSEYEAVSNVPWIGELAYIADIYPSQRRTAEEVFLEEYTRYHGSPALQVLSYEPLEITPWVVRKTFELAEAHLEQLCDALLSSIDVVGFTTPFSQLFASIALAKRLKDKNPSIQTILGGSACGYAPESLLTEYPFIDYIVRGDGEWRLLAILRGIIRGQNVFSASSGIFCQPNDGKSGAQEAEPAENRGHLEVDDLDELATPDYDTYSEVADEFSILWSIPVEGSRGCWWDRRRSSGRPMQSCAFCGEAFGRMWRTKSQAKLSREIASLTTTYEIPRLKFTDSVLGHREGAQLASSLSTSHRDYRFTIELRASVEPMELVLLRDAGCASVQIGIEGLCSGYLKRMNKGTSTIQNLSVMRTAFELGIGQFGNLLIGFPGGTEQEVMETCKNIRDYAIAYEPLFVSPFVVDAGSAVALAPEGFGADGIQHAKALRDVLPAELASNLAVPWLELVTREKTVDWAPVFEECKKWHDLHLRVQKERGYFDDIAKPLFYFDGIEFLEIIDRRNGFRAITLNAAYREVYLFCMNIRTQRRIVERFCRDPRDDLVIGEMLAALLAEKLLFEEEGKYLALAVAWRPELGARRIRQQHEEEQEKGVAEGHRCT